MSQDTFGGDVFVQGTLGCKAFNAPAGSITATAIAANAGIPATALQGEFNLTIDQTGTVVGATRYSRIIRGVPATVVALQAAITETIATGADRTVTIDLKRSTGGGAFASILSAALVFNNVSTLRAVSSAGITSPSLVAGDILQLTVAVAGAAGNQALGLVATVTLREDPS